MKRIFIFADFDFLSSPEEIGILGYERVRGSDHFAFEFSREWLKNHGEVLLSGDLMNVPSVQHPRGSNAVFGFIKDSFPDRWGRLLLDRRELLAAQAEGRTCRQLSNYDYLVGIEDLTRMGAIRYKAEDADAYINESLALHVPPIESLRGLCDACREIEMADERNELPQKRWLDQLIDPGTSLGGARPKANVVDADGMLYVAKFPSKKDLGNVELIEHFSHQMAAEAGINVAKTRIIKISKERDVLLSERFDRTCDGRRIHFASAMSLLGLEDGSGCSTGNGYLDIVDFILRGCTDVKQNLTELYRRVAFNIVFGNTDDHFRNHGFILTPKGWTLSPAYDINPSFGMHQCLLINENTEQSDINALYNASESYMLESAEAKEIIEQVCEAVYNWQSVAARLQIPAKLLAPYARRWSRPKSASK